MAATKGAAKTAAPSRSNGSKSKAKARAAVAEVDPVKQAKTVEFRGLTLDLSAELPKTFMWDASEAADNDMAFYQLVQSLILPEQRGAVRAVLADSDEPADDFMGDLSKAILGAYGLGLGESSASPGS